MALDTLLTPIYGQQPIVINRTKAAVNYWAGYQSSLPIPATKPDTAWVQQRIFAERVTKSPDNYIPALMNFYTQDASIQGAMRDLMDGFPTDEEETTEHAPVMESATSAQMARFAAAGEVTQSQVDQWYDANGFADPPPEPPEEEGGVTRTPRLPT